ncbi:MAG: hypothetical protein OXI43_09780 [Candidatus Poribacteria bacterium]|nr:hypothetical protein [Candidatus Poribacteria bacterium]
MKCENIAENRKLNNPGSETVLLDFLGALLYNISMPQDCDNMAKTGNLDDLPLT